MSDNGTNGKNGNDKATIIKRCKWFGKELPFDWVSDKCINCQFAQACFDAYQHATEQQKKELEAG